MKNSPSIDQLGPIVGSFFRKRHIAIYSLTVIVGVSVAIAMLISVIDLSGQPIAEGPSSSNLDIETIKRIDSLNYANQSQDDFVLPAGRINPFTD